MVVAEWTVILVTLPINSLVLVALMRDRRKPAVVKIFKSPFLTIFLYIAAWDVVGLCEFRSTEHNYQSIVNSNSPDYDNRNAVRIVVTMDIRGDQLAHVDGWNANGVQAWQKPLWILRTLILVGTVRGLPAHDTTLHTDHRPVRRRRRQHGSR